MRQTATPSVLKHAFPCKEVPFGGLVDTLPFGGILGAKRPEMGNPIMTQIANNSKMVRDGEKVTIDHLYETGVGLSESVVILVAMATGLGETLHRSPQNAENGGRYGKSWSVLSVNWPVLGFDQTAT